MFVQSSIELVTAKGSNVKRRGSKYFRDLGDQKIQVGRDLKWEDHCLLQ